MTCPSCQAENDFSARICFACGEALDPALSRLRPGAVFASRYEILGSLGRGGMGMVYRARDRELGETVAIKVLRPDVARQSVRVEKRFRSEIRLARRVRHRNVCSVYGDGVDGGLLYICMELVEGENLARRIRESGALPPNEAWDVVRQVADGLRAIHQAGIVHRDLKTGNLMTDGDGVVRVMDFGIAKHQAAGLGGATITATSALMGTPEYMSPEQLRGEQVDFRSDLYAFGVVIYELFTGTLPFRGPTPVATILRQLQDPPNLERWRLPPSLRPVLARALAKDPSGRPASAAEMRQELHGARLACLPDGDAAVSVAPAGTDRPEATRPLFLLRARPRAPLARIAAGVVGVGALAAHLLAASGVRGPAATRATRHDAGAPAAASAVAAWPSSPPPVPDEGRPTSAVAPSRVSPRGSPPPAAPAAGEPTVVPSALVAAVPEVDTSRVYDRDEVDVPPRRVSGESASYPEWGPTLKRGKRVSITATFVVTENGDVTDIRVEKGERGLEAVLVEISRWKFEPGLKDGIPVKVRVEATHTFIGG
jgi:predicted Ser/Thr protein kinase